MLGLLAAGFVTRTLVEEWPKVSDALRGASIGWLVVGLVLAGTGMASMAWCWKAVLRLLGEEISSTSSIGWYFVGEAGKYLPGGVWPVLGRGEMARRGGVPRGRAYASVALSLAALYLAAMFVAVGFLPFALSGGGFSPWMLFLLALPVGTLGLHHAVLERVLHGARRITGRTIDVAIPRWRDSLLLVVRYVPAWLFIGTATWAVARSLTPDASYPRVVFAAVLSWIAGFLAVPVPAGAGIREAVLTASSGLDPALSATTAVAARLCFIVVDVIGALAGLATVRRRRVTEDVAAASR